MDSTSNARRLRREQTDEEKELWRALRAGRFADSNSAVSICWGNTSRLLLSRRKVIHRADGFQHGLPEQRQRDEEREKILASEGVEELRF